MLDPQAQMSINKTNTGTASYVKRQASGATTTAKPTYVQGSLTEDVAAVTQGQALSPETLRATQILSQREQNLRDFQAGMQSGDPQYRSGGGLSGGGGGVVTPATPQTPGTPPPPQGPAAPTTTEGPGAASALAGYTEDEISAALAGLEAQFGMTRAQLLADQTQAGAQYRLLLAQLERGRVQGIETATNDAVRRGIYRSGILGENIAEVEGATLDQRRVAEEDLSARTTATENQLRNLNAMQAAQAAQIEAQLRGEYARTLLEAGMSPGSAMSGGAAQPMPMPNQALFGDPGYGGAPVTNTQGVGQVAPNLLATPVATQQGAPQPAPLPVVTNPITTNPAPAYRDPREAALAYEQYIQMLNSGTNRFMPQPGTQYQPGGGYRIS